MQDNKPEKPGTTDWRTDEPNGLDDTYDNLREPVPDQVYDPAETGTAAKETDKLAAPEENEAPEEEEEDKDTEAAARQGFAERTGEAREDLEDDDLNFTK